MLPAAVSRSSSDDNAVCYVGYFRFVGDVILPITAIIAQMTHVRYNLKITHRCDQLATARI